MSTQKISVVLPVFNGQQYLSEAIDSVLTQEYTNFEFLICNDASTDKSVEIIKSKEDARIQFIENHTNQGLFKTLNRLIQRSRGEFVHLWSHDDIMKPQCLKTKIKFFQSHPYVGFCYCAFDTIDKFGKLIAVAKKETMPTVVSQELARQLLAYHGSIPGNIANVMIKKSVLDELGLFREDMQQAGDFEMWARIVKKYPIGVIQEPLLYLRSHRNQLCRRKGAGRILINEHKEIFTELMRQLPPEIAEYVERYRKWYDHIRYTHYMIRSFLSGDFQIVKETYRELCQIKNPFVALATWFITVNGRLFKKKPKFYLSA
ncbi:MAG: glycosyltransferase [Candidatus Omnitrophota bacterium]|nr:MAG: glycosyltransferase [Candidatus Omnitrophota bacterium]